MHGIGEHRQRRLVHRGLAYRIPFADFSVAATCLRTRLAQFFLCHHHQPMLLCGSVPLLSPATRREMHVVRLCVLHYRRPTTCAPRKLNLPPCLLHIFHNVLNILYAFSSSMLVYCIHAHIGAH
mmetsp:Transcript_8335/g.25888  ORF Transcript_8335/g.25888 Transcript_8335/m.25888 type:complete len:124 (-) Transcript_8335:59-430(-)